MMITHAILDRRWPHAAHSLVDGMAVTADATFAEYGLTTWQEVADFMAQISEETGGGTAIEENLNYSAARLCQVWPSRFPSIAAAAPYAHNPPALADNVYGGRYGNRPGTDDGWNFRGRGAIQLTFRSNYEQRGRDTGLDLVNHPELVNDPQHFLAVACAYWRAAGVNAFADRGDFRGETLKVNGGYTNYAARVVWRNIWREELQGRTLAPAVPSPALAPSPAAPLAVGDIEGLQAALNRLGLVAPPLAVDGDNGPMTQEAVKRIQARVGLTMDGIVGPLTLMAINAALAKLDAPQPMQQPPQPLPPDPPAAPMLITPEHETLLQRLLDEFRALRALIEGSIQ